MVRDVSPDMGALVGFWCSTLLYGVNLVLFTGCLHVLLKRKHVSREAQLFLLCTSTLQFILSTVHVVTILVQLIQGFITNNTTLGGSTMYFLNQGTDVHVVQEAAYTFNSLIGDGILVWRAYMVWRKDYRIVILPVLLLLGTTVCVCKAIYNLTRLEPNDVLFLPVVIAWLTAIWAMSLALQGLCTLLIATKIWWDSRLSRKAGFGSGKQMSVVWIIVESGAVYSISTVFLMTFFLLKTQAGGIIGHPLGQISAIVPTAIVVRVGLGLHHGSDTRAGDSVKRLNAVMPPSKGSNGSHNQVDSFTLQDHVKVVPTMGSVPSLRTAGDNSYWQDKPGVSV